MVGSGPFRFMADERVPGSLTAYAKFEKYVPRRGWRARLDLRPQGGAFRPGGMASMPDPSTATSALVAGEQDWQEYAYHDQLSLLRRARGVT